MSGKRTAIIGALVTRVQGVQSSPPFGSVNPFVRHFSEVRDRPSVDVTLGNEVRQQLPSMQAKRTTEGFIFVWFPLYGDLACEAVCDSIEAAIRKEETLGGLVTACYATGRNADSATLAQKALGCLRVIKLEVRYHESEL